MKRLVALTMAVLAVSACHKASSTAAGKKSGMPASSDDASAPATKTPVTFTPETGHLVPSEEIPLLEQIDRENTKVLAAVMPGVVKISATRPADPRAKSFSNNLALQFHFGKDTLRDIQATDPSYGAGVILTKDGYIVTNTHVIDSSREIEVQLHDKRTLPARLVASDTSLDIAVLKIDATGLMTIPWANSDRVQLGEQIYAIGNPFNQAGSVSRGIVSAVGRNLPDSPSDENYIQTDAAINPGNSGGPMINIHGELVGINTLIASTSGGNEGVGFAIPSNLVSHAVASLLKEASQTRGYLGVRFPESIDDGVKSQLHLGSKRGALLAGVYPGTPADRAGLQAGDFITEMDGHKIGGAVDLRLVVAQIPIGKEVAVSYIRNGTSQATKVQIVQAPKNVQPGGDTTAPVTVSPTADNVLSGLQVTDLDPKTRQQYGIDSDPANGVFVGSVQFSSPADLKGIARGDVIESVKVSNNPSRELTSAKDFGDVAKSLKPDDGVVLLVHRGKSSSFIYLAPPQK